ncbi:glycine--tRNA ligase subunit beta [Pontibaca methylaminivorans]|uniref:Glycine--tRNA ligase beta subunit n=1 Tax=Pontibaca methylaminivorans TaxID=515897 RepID=A0A1R3WHI0_9RHOB|nr:glycine--tRNA ligase subunit beta [Pontibaca methylaminivorans]SIT77579.1 glycyl-tRNA synthetase beta chain [Pontibaca methylaminivorans]
MPDLLVELLSEEIPARMQENAALVLKKRMTDGLVEAGLTYAHAAAFATPRRLALAIEGLSEGSRALREERKGPRVGAPDKAVEGFARGAGVDVAALERRETPKGEIWFAVIERPGRGADQIVAEVLDAVIRDFPWPKSMRWGTGTLRWVRPLQSILCILTDGAGAQVVPLQIEAITAGDTTEGHRFMAPGRFAVTGFEEYAERLKHAHVVLSGAERADHIRNEAENLAFATGLDLIEDPALLAEVAGLVEWPVVLMGEIEERFLDLPPEVLRTSMREHQKFFSLRDAKTGRILRFITVANRDTADGGATILAGNQKVLAARLSDARFFWENDLREACAGMKDWAEGLKSVTFHNRLGSQAERVERIAALAREIAPLVGADADLAEQAARLAKLDLRSEMVGEFPELQGVMGRYYALESGAPIAVADAARDHYSPLGPTDAVPTAPVSVAVALADKIDTLTGFWAIDEKPTGSKDPFALRRAALGVVRLVLENGLHARLGDVLAKGHAGHDRADLLSFLHDRLKVHLRDEGIRHDVIDACIGMEGSDDLVLLVHRARALDAVLRTGDGENLLQGFRRAHNILTQAEERDGVEYSFGADAKFAEDPAESALFSALDKAEPEIRAALEREDFATAMSAMAALRAPIDAFFEAVQINTDNAVLRRNRLNLLHRICATCREVADLSRIG